MLLRNLEVQLDSVINKNQSALLFGPRQTGKTTLVDHVLQSKENTNILEIPLQNPELRREYEKSPSKLIKQIELNRNSVVFIDEAQKVPELFDSVQYLIDKRHASFIITGSSARKLRKKGTNLLPGRVKFYRLDPLQWNELNWIKDHSIEAIEINNLPTKKIMILRNH